MARSDSWCIWQTLRRIITLCNNDAERLSLYSDARALLADLPAGSYPAKEVQWLVCTCYNRGCQHGKFGRIQQATQFIQAALDLLPFCTALQAKQQVRV